jgi:PAS domain S-box-containing protein
LLAASDGNLWVAGEGEGVFRLDYGTSRWATYSGLHFQCESRDGALWYLTRDRGVIRRLANQWTRFDSVDGLMDRPGQVLTTAKGEVLVIGSQDDKLSIARLKGELWERGDFPVAGSLGQFGTLVMDGSGSVWMITPGGVLQSTPVGLPEKDLLTFTEHTLPEAPGAAQTIECAVNDNIWVGGWYGLRRFDGNSWTVMTEPSGLSSYVDVLKRTSNDELWVGTRLYGLYHYDGMKWTHHNVQNGLADNNVIGILEAADGSIWASTRGGISRFDGRSWSTQALPTYFDGNFTPDGLQETRDGTIWINLGSRGSSKTVHYRPDIDAPQTRITTSLARVSQPGNTALSWEGSDPWRITEDAALQYSYRLTGREWSPYDRAKTKIFLALESGTYTFEVRARDRDFNVDGTPARVNFTVVEPVWQQLWFQVLVAFSIGLIVLQTGRVIRRDRHLKRTNRALSKSNQELEMSEERLTGVVNGAPVVLWALDTSGTVTLSQGKGLSTLGLAPDEAVGKSIFDLYADNPRMVDDARRALEGATFTSMVTFGVSTMEYRFSPFRDAEGEVAGVIGVATDITDRMRAESERARLDDQLQQLRYLYRLRTALGTARTPDEVIRAAGDAITKVLGSASSSGVEIGYDARIWTFGNPQVVGQIQYDRPLAWGGKKRGWLIVHCATVLNEPQERAILDETAGQIIRVLESRVLEMHIMQTNRLVSLGQMAAAVAHELNQPLAAISATAEGLYLRLEEGMAVTRDRTMSMMSDILGLVERMTGTIEYLRIFSRDTSEEPSQRFSINEVVRASLRLVEAQLKSHGVTVRLSLADGLPEILGHPHQMEQVILNLLSNARDALDERGEAASVDRDLKWRKEVHIRTYPDREMWVAIEVVDNGVGIDQDEISRLFEPFYTTKEAERGTGIGLSISHAITQNHGGRIVCESERGQGATFRVVLPVAEEG